MNKKHSGLRRTICALLTCALVTFIFVHLCGCRRPRADKLLQDFKIQPQMLREIHTLNLTPAQGEMEDRSPIDPNKPTGPQIELTLEQCRAAALENNLELKVQLINPAIAAERVSEEEARFEAALYSNAVYAKSDTPVASTLDISGSKVDYGRGDLGVSVPLTTGGTINFDLADSRTKTDSDFSIFNPSYNSNASVSLSQPLLRNAGKRTSTYAIRIAGYDQRISEAQTKLEVIRVIAVIDRLYWRLYAARRELEVRKKEYDLAKLQLEQARRFVNEGERPQVEITRAEAGVARRLEGIILAENTLGDSERDLKRALNSSGLEMQSNTVLIPATEPDPVRYQLESEALVEVALESRMEMLELELQIAKDISTVDYMKNQALPLVTLDYRYNVSGLGGTRADSYDLLYDKRFEDHRLGLQLLVPLGNEAAKSRLNQAFYVRRQRLATKDSRAALIELEVLNAIDQLETNWQRVLAGRQRTILDGRLFEAEKRQYEIGMRTTTDVLLAQTTFADAQSTEIRALAEYQVALVDLAYATGTILGSAKVRWEPTIPQTGND
ncbi:MAG: TolC family protein [Planctomycetota bacterium]|jgi:outer membrane protein TolC